MGSQRIDPDHINPDYRLIYRSEAERYDRLVRREDFMGNLLPAIASIQSPDDRVLLELGAGTGRLTRLLAPHAATITAVDLSAHMLAYAQTSLETSGLANCWLVQADNRRLPIIDQSFDFAIAGWSLGHLIGWHPGDWPQQIRKALKEINRSLRPAGVILIIETLGTGRSAPEPPNDSLAAYYAFLEEENGFIRTWLRTDYKFRSAAEAYELTNFFFGAELARELATKKQVILPECTGIWFKRT